MKIQCPNGTCKGKMDKIAQVGNRVRYVCKECKSEMDITENGK